MNVHIKDYFNRILIIYLYVNKDSNFNACRININILDKHVIKMKTECTKDTNVLKKTDIHRKHLFHIYFILFWIILCSRFKHE